MSQSHRGRRSGSKQKDVRSKPVEPVMEQIIEVQAPEPTEDSSQVGSVNGDSESFSGASGTSPQARSPSPVYASRMKWKQDLIGLNNRLAAYIERVRELECDKTRLTMHIQTLEESTFKETNAVKQSYERELAEARKLLDELANEKARLEVEVKKWHADAEDWCNRHVVVERENAKLKKRVQELEPVESRLKESEAARAIAENQLKTLQAEVQTLSKQMAEAKRQLEQETLRRVEMENRLQTVTEELRFKTQLHEQELTEARSRLTTSISELGDDIRGEYDLRLQEALDEMREDHESQIKATRRDTEKVYESQIKGLNLKLNKFQNDDSTMRQQLTVEQTQVREMTSRLDATTKQLRDVERRLRELEELLANERQQMALALAAKDKVIADQNAELTEACRQQAELVDLKLQLDAEIAAYHAMLSGEEDRLNLSSSSQQATAASGRKRRRVTETTVTETKVSRVTTGAASSGDVVDGRAKDERCAIM